MSDDRPQESGVAPPRVDRGRRWEAFGVIVASLVGLLALLVSGYTAYIQRQQVRAQVWPHLSIAYQDQAQKLTVFNKGVGPAIVRGVKVTVDGKPQPDWEHALAAMALPHADSDYGHSTLATAVLGPGDALAVLVFDEKAKYRHFRTAMSAHGLVDICYCSTLGDCWLLEDHRAPVKPAVRPVGQCPRLTPEEAFRD